MSFLLSTSRSAELAEWREAAALVRDRWAQILAAERSSRGGAYAAYTAALDLEEAAAAVLARRFMPLAA